MIKIIDLKFMSLEFDFGYTEEDENSYESKGNIDAELLATIENDGEMSTIKHKTNFKGVSFSDFMSEEDISNEVKPTDNLAEYIQILRKVIILKVASELGFEVADIDYIPAQPMKDKVSELENGLLEMSINLGEEAQEKEQAILELSMLIGGNE